MLLNLHSKFGELVAAVLEKDVVDHIVVDQEDLVLEQLLCLMVILLV